MKSLELCDQYHNAFFNEDISDIAKLKLKNYKLIGGETALTPKIVDHNFIRFLAMQSLSLERLYMQACTPKVFEYIVNNMRALKYLKVLYEFETKDLRLNLNIDELSIPNIKNSEDIERIIAWVPNLTKLHIHTLTRKNVEIIKHHLPALQDLLFVRRNENI